MINRRMVNNKMDGRILVVDDDNVVRITLTDMLSKVGYQVDSADSGRAALEQTKSKKYDVILLDVILPDRNGIEILNEIKRASPSTETIIITGFGMIEDAVRAVKRGAYDYVCKPFKKNEIPDVVKRALEERKVKEKFQKEFIMEDGIEIFKNMVGSGTPALCITAGDPAELERRYNVQSGAVVKLDKLSEMMEAINRFITENRPAVILLSGFEKLLKEYSPKQLKEFILELRDPLAVNQARLILVYDKASMDPETLKKFMHAVSEARLYSLFNILANPIRRDSLLYLESQEKPTFTKIQRALEVENAPNLSFHLRNLKNAGLVEEDSEKRYFLTNSGREICELLKRFEINSIKKLENIILTNAG